MAELARRAHSEFGEPAIIEDHPQTLMGHPILATFWQTLWLLAGLVVGSSAAYFAAFAALPWLIHRLGLIPFLLLAPFLLFAALVIYTPLSILLAAAVKKALIGRYRPLRAPVWGSFYMRNWMVQQIVRLCNREQVLLRV